MIWGKRLKRPTWGGGKPRKPKGPGQGSHEDTLFLDRPVADHDGPLVVGSNGRRQEGS